MFNTLFSPITINKLEIRNRILYPALGLMYSFDKRLNERYLNFYRERAKGGAGIVTVGPAGFDELGGGIVMPSIASDKAVPSFSLLTKAIKEEGARAWIQLYHGGAYMHSFTINHKQAVAPSAVPSAFTKETPREMSIEDIKTVQQAFVDGALRAKEAGFDGVEIIGSAGYLITQFWSPLKNRRTDEYGGSFENRGRFAAEIIRMMRKELGPDYPITIRMAGNDFVPGSNTDREAAQIAMVYQEAGVDAINVTGGWHESRVPQLSMELPRGGFSYLALNVRRNVTVPVIASNRIADPYTAEEIVKDGVADMVSLGRVLIADPYWPEKARQERVSEIRPCISCSQGCTDETFSGRPVFCVVNSRAGFEGERNIEPAPSAKYIMVVGAGPGGMEAAVRAAEAGHRVELYEQKADIGGQLWIAGTPPYKQEIWEIIRYYDTMLDKYQVDVFLEHRVNLDFIKEKNPDCVIIAQGAGLAEPSIEGIDDSSVISSWELLENDPMLGRDVAVIGGGAAGLETAEFVASKGTISPEVASFLFKYNAEDNDRIREFMRKGSKNVTVFEMQPRAGEGVGISTRWILMGNINMLDVDIITGARVVSVRQGLVTYEKDGALQSKQFDNVINAAGVVSVKELSSSMSSTGIPFRVIGDCLEPRRINDAIHEGFLAVMDICRDK